MWVICDLELCLNLVPIISLSAVFLTLDFIDAWLFDQQPSTRSLPIQLLLLLARFIELTDFHRINKWKRARK